MTKPLRIDCASEAELPSSFRIRELATDEYHVVLLLDTNALKRRCLIDLALELPDFTVFDSGCHQGKEAITIVKVISSNEILKHAAEFVAAARLFRETASSLAQSLSSRLGINLKDLILAPKAKGRLDREWSFAFHGLECFFRNRKTGQELEVRLEFGDEFGVLDPLFFARFIRSTSAYFTIGHLLNDDFHDTRRVFKVLTEAGYFRGVTFGAAYGTIVNNSFTLLDVSG
jgi:hypothetical protein